MSTVSLWRGADLPMSSCKRALLLLWLFLGGGALLLLLFRAVIAGAYGQASEDVWAWFLPNIIPTLSLMIGVVVMDENQTRERIPVSARIRLIARVPVSHSQRDRF